MSQIRFGGAREQGDLGPADIAGIVERVFVGTKGYTCITEDGLAEAESEHRTRSDEAGATQGSYDAEAVREREAVAGRGV